ncbi:MAG TPA: DUF2304 domain-containing protein [Blastocatellia bacterium]|nr:DUF2304 domain-containing protein [Blastocatellia bacterium]
MNLIQVTLTLASVAIVALYFARMRSQLLDRVVVGALFMASLVAIIRPDLTTTVAHYFGVGRGSDLVFYLMISGLAFICVVIYIKLRKLEETQTIIIREIAIRFSNPHDGSPGDSRESPKK